MRSNNAGKNSSVQAKGKYGLGKPQQHHGTGGLPAAAPQLCSCLAVCERGPAIVSHQHSRTGAKLTPHTGVRSATAAPKIDRIQTHTSTHIGRGKPTPTGHGVRNAYANTVFTDLHSGAMKGARQEATASVPTKKK